MIAGDCPVPVYIYWEGIVFEVDDVATVNVLGGYSYDRVRVHEATEIEHVFQHELVHMVFNGMIYYLCGCDFHPG